MKLYFSVAGDVFRDPFNVALAGVVMAASAVLLAWAGQIVVRAPIGGLYWDLQPSRLAAIGAISLGFGLVVPLQVAALRQLRAAARARAGAGLAVSSFTGLAAVSCCSPLLVPVLAGLVGASGTTALSVNLAVHRWFLPLSLVSIGLLALSAVLAVRGLTRGCLIVPVEQERANGRIRADDAEPSHKLEPASRTGGPGTPVR